MIIKLVPQEIYQRKEKGKIFRDYVLDDEKVFINDEDFIHNDIGAAYSYEGSKGVWFWNGIKIE